MTTGEKTIDHHAFISPVHKPGLTLNKNHPCVLRGSQTSYPYLQVSILHCVPYQWVLQFCERLEKEDELLQDVTWTDWQKDTCFALRSEMRRREKLG